MSVAALFCPLPDAWVLVVTVCPAFCAWDGSSAWASMAAKVFPPEEPFWVPIAPMVAL